MFCKKCGKEIQEGTAYCPKCGTPIRRGYIEGFQTSGQQQYGLSMTWYQFVTSLGIWLSAVVYAVFAIRTFLGSAYIEQMMLLLGILQKLNQNFLLLFSGVMLLSSES